MQIIMSLDFEKKNVQNERIVSIKPLNYRKSVQVTCKSRSPTSNIVLRSVDTSCVHTSEYDVKKLCNWVRDKRLYAPSR